MLRGDSLLASEVFVGIELAHPPEPVFSRVPVAAQQTLRSRADERERPNDLAGYQHAFAPGLEGAEELAARLRRSGDVHFAEVQARPVPAFILDESRRSRVSRTLKGLVGLQLHAALTADYSPLQSYLDRSPRGIGVRALQISADRRGHDILIADVESGWRFSHEDLIEAQRGVRHGINGSFRDHGTAVLGILGGDANGWGVEGAAPGAVCSGFSAEYDAPDGRWNPADAIRAAADELRPGDVILLEMHAPGPNASGRYDQQGFIAVEYWHAEFAAIQYATDRGIHVVAAAGNGAENLDAPAYGGRFDRTARDSGAILVGAGASALQPDARSRIWWSNYGSRLDVQGWGEDIVTTGGREAPHYHDLRDDPDPDRCYTQSFGGTSAAAPIVAGAAAAIEGVLRAEGRSALKPAALRELLGRTGTAQTDGPDGPASQRIGPLPDVEAALLGLRLDPTQPRKPRDVR